MNVCICTMKCGLLGRGLIPVVELVYREGPVLSAVGNVQLGRNLLGIEGNARAPRRDIAYH